MNTLMRLLILVLCSSTAFSQSHEYVYRNNADSSFNCYLKVFPKTSEIKGLVIRDYSSLPDMNRPARYDFSRLCSEAGLMTLYTVSSPSYPELFCSDASMTLLDEMIAEVVAAHDIPKSNIFIGGISASGTRALRYTQYCEQGKSAGQIHINGVFAVDSPLDLERFYRSVQQHMQYFKKGMLEEAIMMEQVFPTLFDGSPDTSPEEYVRASVFSHTDPSGGNAHILKSTAMILFHEPDLDWWLNERGCSYYDFNSFDIAAFVVTLKKLGNQEVQLVTTTGKGFDHAGNRNCHSWSIVDEQLLVTWIKNRLIAP